MTPFDPFTATLEDARAQPDADAAHGSVLRWGAAQNILQRRDYFEKHPLEGVSSCVRAGLIAPDWLANPFIWQYDAVLNCRASTWDEAFGPSHPAGKHLSTLRLRRQYGIQLEQIFTNSEFHGRKALPRTLEGRREAARILGITEKQVRTLLKTTRKNVKGHKPYSVKSQATVSANDPFSLGRKTPKK